LSNTLGDFAKHDDEGRRKVIEQIKQKREAWKDVTYELKTGRKRNPEPAKALKPTEIRTGMTEAEIKVELQKTRVNISKNKLKIEEKPDHKNRGAWEEELARLEAIKDDYETELIRLKYETA